MSDLDLLRRDLVTINQILLNALDDETTKIDLIHALLPLTDRAMQQHRAANPPPLKPMLRPGDRVTIVDRLDYSDPDAPPVKLMMEVRSHGKRMFIVEVDGQPVEPYIAPNGLPCEYDVPVSQSHWDSLVELVQLQRVPK